MKKQTICLLSLIICLSLTLCACSSKETSGDALAEDTEQTIETVSSDEGFDSGFFGKTDKYGLPIIDDPTPYDFMTIVDHPEMYNECVDGIVTTDLNYVTRVSQNSDGYWIYNLRGAEIPLKNNIWDYITREVDNEGKVHWYFDLKTASTNMGYIYMHYAYVKMEYPLEGELTRFSESTDFSRDVTTLFNFNACIGTTYSDWQGDLNKAVFESADGSEEGCAYTLEQVIFKMYILEKASEALEDPIAYLGWGEDAYISPQLVNSTIAHESTSALYGFVPWGGEYVFD